MNDKQIIEAATVLHPGDVLLVKVGSDVAVEDLHGLREVLGETSNKVVVFANDIELMVIPAAKADAASGYCPRDHGCSLTVGHEGECSLTAALCFCAECEAKS